MYVHPLLINPCMIVYVCIHFVARDVLKLTPRKSYLEDLLGVMSRRLLLASLWVVIHLLRSDTLNAGNEPRCNSSA